MTLRQCQVFFHFYLAGIISHRCVGFPLRFHPLYDKIIISAGMVELADTLDLGSNGIAVQVQVLLPAPQKGQFVLRRIGLFARSVLWAREEMRRIVGCFAVKQSQTLAAHFASHCAKHSTSLLHLAGKPYFTYNRRTPPVAAIFLTPPPHYRIIPLGGVDK